MKAQDNPAPQLKHVAIIMDGNGRWAKQRLFPRTLGHRAGMTSLKNIVRACSDLQIPVLSVYAFSTENWKRPQTEVGYLMDLLVEYLFKEIDELHENNVRILWSGRYEQMPAKCVSLIESALHKTAANTGLVFNLALNYGARDELNQAIKQIVRDVENGELSLEAIDDNVVKERLYTKNLPDPDLLIRTAGEMRLSNFMLWQLAYTEIVVVDTLWPDFNEPDLLKALALYAQRDRRFGGLKDK